MRSLLPLSFLALLLLPAAGCARCASSARARADAGPPGPLTTPPLLPPPRAWTFAPVRRDAPLALPERCRARGPLVQAPVAPTTRFLAVPDALATLVVADSATPPPRLTGVAALTLDPAGTSRDPAEVPWFVPGAVPHLGRGARAWLGAFDRTGGTDGAGVVLWRGGTAEILGQGDAFESVDLACAADRCAVLTSRLAKVAQPGAALWIGSPDTPAARWTQAEIVPAAPDSNARPFGIAGIDAARAIVTLTEKSEAVFWSVEGAARELARVPAPHGVLDAIDLPGGVVAMTYGTPVDDDGCAREAAAWGGAILRFERPGKPGVEVKVPAPPIGGHLRRLGEGAIAAWIAPLGCKQQRRVVYAVVLDAEGVPASTPMAVGDAESFALAAKGADVDLHVQHAGSVTWARMTCSAR